MAPGPFTMLSEVEQTEQNHSTCLKELTVPRQDTEAGKEEKNIRGKLFK